jgi:hypothetical protein
MLFIINYFIILGQFIINKTIGYMNVKLRDFEDINYDDD